MLFNSFTFFIFLIALIAAYYSVRKANLQVWLLILASIYFYGFYRSYLVPLLIISATVNMLVSYTIAYAPRGHKAVAVTGVIMNIALLSFFKYGALFWHFFTQTLGFENFSADMVVPAGMSFYTFEGISLIVDVFKGRQRGEEHLVPRSFIRHTRNTFFFISFFPHLVSGPILKAHDFLPQIGVKKLVDVPWEKCFKLLIAGFFLKMVVADNLKDFTAAIGYPMFKYRSSYNLIVMPFGLLVQIFSDFAGYSLIAVGVARIFGYRFLQNFNFPFIATSFREFWQRWNISLSKFLTEYLYIPLGGNRKGAWRTCINILITMTIGGIWHGGTLGFLLWGFCHGLVLVTERVFNTDKLAGRNKLMAFLCGSAVFVFVAAAAMLFRLEPSQLVDYVRAIRTNYSFNADFTESLYILIYSAPVVVYHLFYIVKNTRVYPQIRRLESVIYAIMLFLILTDAGSSSSFMYFQF